MCTRRLRAGRWLTLIARGDRRYFAARAQPSLPRMFWAWVGVRSMRERAAEVGGSCAVEAPRSGGTRVYAQLRCKAPSVS